ncbi:MAG TPA: ATP synthase subunit I [Burkholderiales bacterium]|nr:ATP synthase subunit I [Burkholderiales bacterium]
MSAEFGYNFSALLAAKKPNATLRQLSKPIRTVIAWQAAATLVMTLAGAAFIGIHGAVSAAAGGSVSIIAGLAAAWVAARGSGNSAGGILAGALRAEAVKVGLVVLLLWLVLANYAEAIVVVVIGAFVVTMLIFAMAFFVREY